MRKVRTTGVMAAVLVASLALACSDPLRPFEPQVSNSPDNFEVQATGVIGVTLERTYVWQNSGTRATINHSTTTENGIARVVILDAAGVVVYDKALVPSLNEPTLAGTPGAWQIELILTGYTGTLNFRVQKL